MSGPVHVASRAGVVVIGRNEGERLQRCLESVLRETDMVVYVDSGSSDGSVALARAMGALTVELDPSEPFTAARARNEGLRFLREREPGMAYVQFVDGDCELLAGWLALAHAFLEERKDVALVCGRLRERDPGRSVYNLLCEIEWDALPGEARRCGGIALARTEAIARVGGFRVDLIAGEEPELCIRLRAAGWRVWRLEPDMALHDAAITRFGQWWRRSRRAGFAYAEGASLHGQAPERHYVREAARAYFWGIALPLTALAAFVAAWPLGVLAFAAYPVQVIRLALQGRRRAPENWWRAAFLVLGKFPEAQGQIEFLVRRWRHGGSRLIEYK
jgi:glycosyltransferase involved in cell wall biosynthesis